MGSGSGLILLHGGIMGSQNLMKLDALLSDDFTICLPDRHDRGMGRSFGDNYGLEREVEDLDALF